MTYMTAGRRIGMELNRFELTEVYDNFFEIVRLDTDYEIEIGELMDDILMFLRLCPKLRFIRGRVSDPLLLASCYLLINEHVTRNQHGEVIPKSLEVVMQQYQICIREWCTYL
jgi:hypothetical protein